VGDWKECAQCNGTGRHAGQRCDMCIGDGWQNVRPRF
jgi:DnaJ-class molecular chaperone